MAMLEVEVRKVSAHPLRKDFRPYGAGRENSQFNAVSFFTGCGGLDLGFLGGFKFMGEKYPILPFKIKKAYDIDKKCVETYKQNIGDEIECADLRKIDLSSIPHADVLIGGFPCQDFSSCGPKRGMRSSRGKLYQVLVEFMKLKRPKIVIGENVPHLKRIREGQILKRIVSDLENVGYRCSVWDLYAPNHGVPQTRSRLFFVCVRDDIKGTPIEPEKSFAEIDYRTIDWAIGNLKRMEDDTIPNQSQFFTASKAKNGNGQGDEVSKKGRPAYTVRANAKSRVQFHYELSRRLTVRECARLQSFPDDFIFPHSATTNIMQIGNAVPPMLGYRVAQSVASFLESLR
jgi:DNA (cytosine-5)-methyltransferase 1